MSRGSRRLRLATLAELGGAQTIVRTHVDRSLSDLPEKDRAAALDIFHHLVTPSGTKIALAAPDLAAYTSHSDDEVEALLECLARGDIRILRPVPAVPGSDGRTRFEISHDLLAPAILDWRARQRAARLERERNIAQQRALEEEQRARAAERHAQRLRLAARAVFGLLVAVIACIAIWQWRTALSDRDMAESRQLAAGADLNLGHDPQLSALLALQGLRLHHTSQAETALRQALPQVQALRTLQNGSTVLSAAFDPIDRTKVASAGKDGVAWMWDVKTGKRLVRLWPKSGLAGAASSVSFNPAGTEVVVGYGLGDVVLFDARSGKQLQSSGPVLATVNDVRFMGGTDNLAIATLDGTYLWRHGLGHPCCHPIDKGNARSIAVAPRDSVEFAVTTNTGTVIWNVCDLSRLVPRKKSVGNGNVNDAEFSPDGSKLLTAGGDGKVRVYSLTSTSKCGLPTVKEVMTLNAVEGSADGASFSPDGKRIVAAYASGMTRVWDASTGLPMSLLTGHASGANTVRFDDSGSEAVTAGDDGTIRVWYTKPRELQTAFTSSWYRSLPNPASAAEYSSDGKQIVVVDDSGNAYLFTDKGQPVYYHRQQVVLNPGATVRVYSARFNRAGTEIVTANSDGTVDLWKASSGSPIHLPSPIKLTGYASPPQYADFSSDGSRIVIVTDDSTAEVRSATTGRRLKVLNPHHGFLLSVAVFNPSGNRILTADYNGQVEEWNARTGQEMTVLGTPGPAVNDIEFNRNGSQFVTANSGGVVTVWSSPDDHELLSIGACPSPSTASFSPDGSKIVVACGDGSAPVFDASTGQLLTVLQAATAGTINSASFSPSGKSIVTTYSVSGTGGVRIWSSELATSSLPALERIAGQRITRRLTAAERKTYLAGIHG